MKLYSTFINEWGQIFGGYNWTNWNLCFIGLSYENDIILGAWELELVLFGLGIRLRLTKPIETPEMLELKEQVKQLDAGTLKTTPWDEIHDPFMIGRCPRCYFKIDGSEKEEKSEQ